MAKVKVWQPVALDDLPLGLLYALNAANQEPKRNWMVCEAKVLSVEPTDSAEVQALKRKIELLQRQLESRRVSPVPTTPIDTLVRESIMHGQVIKCSADVWPEFRAALKRLAGKLLADGAQVYANVALNEIRRLDRVHGFKEEENGESTAGIHAGGSA